MPTLTENPRPELQAKLDELRQQHALADERLTELDRRVWLSPDEQVELARLKKRKLWLKDEMRVLAQKS